MINSNKRLIGFKKWIAIMILTVMSVSLLSVVSFADTEVYITATGTKYHLSTNCKGLSNAKSITGVSLSYAQSKGYSPCAICAGGTSGGSGSGSGAGETGSGSTANDYSSQLTANSSLVFTPALQELLGLPSVKITKPVASKGAVTVKWKKVSKKNQKKIQGIEIQISTDSQFQNIVKSVTAGKKKTSKKIKGLKSKTKYWVRIRAYKNAPDGKHVSAWKTKSFKAK